jgi:hypothetical protein
MSGRSDNLATPIRHNQKELYELAEEMRIAFGSLCSLYPIDPTDQQICERWDRLVERLGMEERYGISHNENLHIPRHIAAAIIDAVGWMVDEGQTFQDQQAGKELMDYIAATYPDLVPDWIAKEDSWESEPTGALREDLDRRAKDTRDCPSCGDDIEDGCPCAGCNIVYCVDCVDWCCDEDDEDCGDWFCFDCKGKGDD